jgi:hypothetical protein
MLYSPTVSQGQLLIPERGRICIFNRITIEPYLKKRQLIFSMHRSCIGMPIGQKMDAEALRDRRLAAQPLLDERVAQD